MGIAAFVGGGPKGGLGPPGTRLTLDVKGPKDC